MTGDTSSSLVLSQTAIKAGYSYSGTTLSLSMNCGNNASVAATSYPTPTELSFGSGPAFTRNNYWLRSFSYYNTALNSTQLQTISEQL